MDQLLIQTAGTGALIAVLAYLGLGYRDVGPDERGVVKRLGRLHKVVEPGKTRIWLGLESFQAVSMRPFALLVEAVGPAKDGEYFRVGLKAEARVLQPERTLEGRPDCETATRNALEAALRQVLADMSRPDLPKLGKPVKKVANEGALTWGVDVQAVEALTLEQLGSPPGWEVVLQSPGRYPIQVMRTLRQHLPLELKGAKALVDATGPTVATCLGFAEADALRAGLVNAGARVQLLPARDSVEQPAGIRVVLVETGPNTIAVLKAVREATALGLAEAKALLEHSPRLLKACDSEAEAHALVESLERAGARAAIERD